MENNALNTNQPQQNKKFPFGGLLVLIIIIGGIVLLTWWRSDTTEKEVKQFAKEQLELQKYTILKLTVLESDKNKSNYISGKVEFVVKNSEGLTFEGNASIADESNGVLSFSSKRVFTINEIKPQQ